jgi:hypothetical protein
MPSIDVSKSILDIKQKMENHKREILLLEGSLKVYNEMFEQGVKSIPVPEIVVVKDEPRRCECSSTL